MNPVRVKAGAGLLLMILLMLLFMSIPGMGAVAAVCALIGAGCLVVAILAKGSPS